MVLLSERSLDSTVVIMKFEDQIHPHESQGEMEQQIQVELCERVGKMINHNTCSAAVMPLLSMHHQVMKHTLKLITHGLFLQFGAARG